ncbi:MAG: VCBS repeat-containing protein, partial [bacterium]|nr:VCBS repeat-containing protein [bacterium]
MGWSNKRHRLLAVWTLRSAAVLAVITVGVLLTRDPGEEEVRPGDSVAGLTSVLSRGPGPEDAPIRFADATAASGIDFRHFPDERESLLPEDMGSGIACGDYDGDGQPDLFFVNFAGSVADPLPDVGPVPAARCRLYRNLGEMRFEDVTDRAGVKGNAWSIGVAVADYDADGDFDLYLLNWGPNT